MKKKLILYWFITTGFSILQPYAACSQATAAPLTLNQYMAIAPGLTVVDVAQKVNMLTISACDTSGVITPYTIALNCGEVYMVTDWKLKKPQISLVTIPFKLRPKTDSLPTTASADLKNIGLNFNLLNIKRERFFANGTKSTQQFGVGLFISPLVEKLNATNTRNFTKKESSQLFISTGLSITYTINDISFCIIPAGIDLPTTPDGEHYDYGYKYWFGLGIGITAKAIGKLF